MSFSQYIAGAFAASAAIFGKRVKYTRATGGHVYLDAVQGRTTFDATDDDGVTITFVSTDFIFPACLLVIEGEQVTPNDYDEITTDGKTYEVARPGSGQSWSYSDTTETQLRVHTKLKGII